jgi:hypothetical protein
MGVQNGRITVFLVWIVFVFPLNISSVFWRREVRRVCTGAAGVIPSVLLEPKNKRRRGHAGVCFRIWIMIERLLVLRVSHRTWPGHPNLPWIDLGLFLFFRGWGHYRSRGDRFRG